MLKFDDIHQVGTVTAYGDDQKPNLFYIIPSGPTYRINEQGLPVFYYAKYRELREGPDGDFFGGLVAFDTCLAVPPEVKEAIRPSLQDVVNRRFAGRPAPGVEFGSLSYTSGTVQLTLENATGKLVQKASSAGVPSLYGDNVATFWVELTKEGATIFEQALQGGGGNLVSVIYKVKVWAKMPPLRGTARWHASKFYSFFQDVDTEDNFWSEDSYTETIREQLYSNESLEVHIDSIAIPGLSPEEQAKMDTNVRTMVTTQLEAMVERNMLQAIQAVDPNIKSLREDQDIEDIKRTVNKAQISDVSIDVSETRTVEWGPNPQGGLPSITRMKGPNGQLLKWEDFSDEIDLDDPFFRTLEVTVMVNADFDDLPIFNVEAKLTYPFGDTTIKEFVFKSPNDIGKFRTFTVDNKKTYKYVYTVNYKNEARSFTSPEIEIDDTQLTINVDDLGIWAVDVAPGDINFTQVKQAQIAVRLEDGNVSLERQFTMTEQNTAFKVREVTMQPRRTPFKFRVKYFMTDGKEFDSGWQAHDAQQLYINDPFAATQTVSLRAAGDLTNRITSILVDVTYTDAANAYVQRKTIALSKDVPFDDWSFPVISETGGKVVYTATILYNDGTSREIPETVATRTTISIGDVFADKLDITVVPVLDFGVVKIANISLAYKDEANDISERKDLLFRQGTEDSQTWSVEIKNRQKLDYTWSAKFFLVDGSHKELPMTTTQDPTVFLELPA